MRIVCTPIPGCMLTHCSSMDGWKREDGRKEGKQRGRGRGGLDRGTESQKKGRLRIRKWLLGKRMDALVFFFSVDLFCAVCWPPHFEERFQALGFLCLSFGRHALSQRLLSSNEYSLSRSPGFLSEIPHFAD